MNCTALAARNTTACARPRRLTHWPRRNLAVILNFHIYLYKTVLWALVSYYSRVTQDITKDKSILVHVMTWCRQAIISNFQIHCKEQ